MKKLEKKNYHIGKFHVRFDEKAIRIVVK